MTPQTQKSVSITKNRTTLKKALLLKKKKLILTILCLEVDEDFYIQFPQSWVQKTSTNFGKGKGKTKRSKYTQYYLIDVYESICNNSTLFHSLTLFTVDQFDNIINALSRPENTNIKVLSFKNTVNYFFLNYRCYYVYF